MMAAMATADVDSSYADWYAFKCIEHVRLILGLIYIDYKVTVI